VNDQADSTSLPGDVLELIVQHLPRSDHAAARLTCRDMKALIAPMLRTVYIKHWEELISTVSSNSVRSTCNRGEGKYCARNCPAVLFGTTYPLSAGAIDEHLCLETVDGSAALNCTATGQDADGKQSDARLNTASSYT
jgi:hypothetical protein